MKSIKQLSLKIYNSIKRFFKDMAVLQSEIMKFDEEYKQYLEGKK